MRSFRYASSVDSRALFCARLKKKAVKSRLVGRGVQVAPPSHRQVYNAGGDDDHIAKENKAGHKKLSALIFIDFLATEIGLKNGTRKFLLNL